MPAAVTAPEHAAARARIHEIEAGVASLGHDLRGALSPALIFSDRLVSSTDPAIRKAGEAVVRSIEQASVLIAASKILEPPNSGAPGSPPKPTGPAAGPGGP